MNSACVGGLAFFFPAPSDHLGEGPLVAIITDVSTDTDTVNLAVFSKNGEGATARQNIDYVDQPSDEQKSEPPYATGPYMIPPRNVREQTTAEPLSDK